MAEYKIDIAKLDEIVNKTIYTINSGKAEIYNIAENAIKDSRRLENELLEIKNEIIQVIEYKKCIEHELKECKKNLTAMNKNCPNLSEDSIKAVFDKEERLRIELAVKREQEKNLLKRRNEFESRLKESQITVIKAEELISHVGVSMEYLTSDLKQISTQLEDLHQRQCLGLKIIKTQEEERQRVAREIHDGPAQSLSNIVLKAEICERLMDVDVEKVREELHNLKEVVRQSIQDIRRIIYNLRPMSLDDLGLIPTLQKFVAIFKNKEKINVLLKIKGNHANLDSVISLAVFRIVQESLSNVKKHSNANNCFVNLEFIKDRLLICISDNGKGFDVERLKPQNDCVECGFGLFSMRERVQLLNGQFEIISDIDEGTKINISIPLNE